MDRDGQGREGRFQAFQLSEDSGQAIHITGCAHLLRDRGERLLVAMQGTILIVDGVIQYGWDGPLRLPLT